MAQMESIFTIMVQNGTIKPLLTLAIGLVQ